MRKQSNDLFRNIAFWIQSRTTAEEILPERTLNELISFAALIESDIKKADTFEALERCEQLTSTLYPGFYHLERCPYWLNRLHTRILLRRTDLLARPLACSE